MPKRKRSDNDDGGRNFKSRGKTVQETLAQSTKLLHRALKTAKGFERQKLGQRLTRAKTQNEVENIGRITREIEALKSLDMPTLTETHLHKTLLKVKTFAESEMLPEEVRKPIQKLEGTEQTLAAISNVTSGMCNTKPVKDVMQQIISGMYVAMGIPTPKPGNSKAKKPKEQVVEAPVVPQKGKIATDENSKLEGDDALDNESWEGLGTDLENEVEPAEENSGAESLDEEELSRYDALLGASSDEESFDEDEYRAKRTTEPESRLSLSLSPEPSPPPASEEAKSLSPEPAPEPQAGPKRAAKAKPAPTKGSTFLPSLIGGYWSGSESEASELEDFKPAARKNRRGQKERQAIAEKKFGEKAKHIVAGKGSVVKSKDDGWDAKRGAKDPNEREGRFRGPGRGGPQRSRNYEKATGDNAIAVVPKPRGAGKKDDVGVLHPSWQAAKKAKEAKQNVAFQGKKVTFD